MKPIQVCVTACMLAPSVSASELARLYPDPPVTDSRFGFSVAIDNFNIAVGAILDSGGSVQVYNPFSYDRKQRLAAGAGSSAFGYSIDLHGGVAIIGNLNALVDFTTGNAFLHTSTASGFDFIDSLAEYGSGSFDDRFGIRTAITDDFALVGAFLDDEIATNAGAAYLFALNDLTHPIKLFADDAVADHRFGIGVEVNNDYAIISAYRSDFSGTVYVFDTATGTQLYTIDPPNPGTNFGYRDNICIVGNEILIGADGEDIGGTNSGRVYRFNLETGALIGELVPNDHVANKSFGSSIAADGQAIVIGAEGDDTAAENAGAVYVFDRLTGNQVAKYTASDSVTSMFLGVSVDINTEIIVAGAPQPFQDEPGRAYVFAVPDTLLSCNTADLEMPFQLLDLADISAFVNGFVSGDLIADINSDGLFDLSDIGLFVTAFTGGCP